MKYRILRKKLKIRISRLSTFGTYEPLTDEDVDELDAWVKQTKTGRRVAYDMWQMRDKECLALFMLRWS